MPRLSTHYRHSRTSAIRGSVFLQFVTLSEEIAFIPVRPLVSVGNRLAHKEYKSCEFDRFFIVQSRLFHVITRLVVARLQPLTGDRHRVYFRIVRLTPGEIATEGIPCFTNE